MNKREFLRGLEEALLEHMHISQAAPHIRYYQDYIESEVRSGRDEEDIVASLQNPRLVAKNIINNSKSANKYKSDVSENRTESYSNYDNSYESTHGTKKTAPFTFSVNGKPINSLWFKIALAAILIILVVLVLVIVGGILWIITRFVLPVALIGGAIYLIVRVLRNNL